MREKDSLFVPSFENFTNELTIFLVICGLLLIAFSRSKKEDELSAKLRLNALHWAVMIYYVFYIIGLLFSITIGEIPFFGDHMNEINLFTPLVIFIIRYYYLKYMHKDQYLVDHPKLLPAGPFRKIGIVLAFVGLGVLVANEIINPLENLVSDISFVVLVFGLLFWTFSKDRNEDELAMQQRLESLQLAVYFNYIIILIATLFIYSLGYLYVLVFAQFSILFFFVLRATYIAYQNNRLLKTMEGRFES